MQLLYLNSITVSSVISGGTASAEQTLRLWEKYTVAMFKASQEDQLPALFPAGLIAVSSPNCACVSVSPQTEGEAQRVSSERLTHGAVLVMLN